MNRSIPGTENTEDREFMYIESDLKESFRKLVDAALASRADIEMPQSGGVLEEKARLQISEGIFLRGISYRGDIAGWRAKFIGYCEASHRKYAFIKGKNLALSSDAIVPLSELEVIFEK